MIIYCVFFLPTFKPYLYSLSDSVSGTRPVAIYPHSCSEFRMSIAWFSRHPLYIVLNERVSMGLTDRRKTAKNLVDSRKN